MVNPQFIGYNTEIAATFITNIRKKEEEIIVKKESEIVKRFQKLLK